MTGAAARLPTPSRLAWRHQLFKFDPFDEGEVMTMVRKISQYARAMQPAQLQARN